MSRLKLQSSLTARTLPVINLKPEISPFLGDPPAFSPQIKIKTRPELGFVPVPGRIAVFLETLDLVEGELPPIVTDCAIPCYRCSFWRWLCKKDFQY